MMMKFTRGAVLKKYIKNSEALVQTWYEAGLVLGTDNGMRERGLAVLEVTANGSRTVSEAPSSFDNFSNPP